MLEKLKETLKAKQPIIVMTIITVYLVALAIKTGHVFYTEYWLKRHESQQTTQVQKTQPPVPVKPTPPIQPETK